MQMSLDVTRGECKCHCTTPAHWSIYMHTLGVLLLYDAVVLDALTEPVVASLDDAVVHILAGVVVDDMCGYHRLTRPKGSTVCYL